MSYVSTSPSQASMFFACPGCIKAQRAIELDLPDNDAALEGSAIHEAAAKCITRDLNPSVLLGSPMEIRTGDGKMRKFTITDDVVFTLQVYKKTIYEILAREGLSRSALQVEIKFKLPEIDPDANGTVDCCFIAGDSLYVIDLKSGRGVLVDPRENKQCMYYALRPFLDAQLFIRKVHILIIQPRAKDSDFVKEWITTPERLTRFKDELKDAIAATKVNNPELKAGDHCIFCRAKATCPAYNQALREPLVPAVRNISTAFAPPESLTPEEIGRVLPAARLLKAYIDTLEGYAYTLAMDGKEIPGYTVVRGKKRRQWRDEQAVIDKFISDYGAELYETKLRSPAQLEKLIGKKEVEDFIFTPEGELKLAPTKEAEEIIKRSVEEAFKNVKFEEPKGEEDNG